MGVYGSYSDPNFGFSGEIPQGVTIEGNIIELMNYRSSHSFWETLQWFYDQARNNKDGHLSFIDSMDYKQIDGKWSGTLRLTNPMKNG